MQIMTNYKSLLILLVVFLAIALLSDVFLSSKNLVNVLRQVCASSVIGVGFTFAIASGNIDLSVGTLIGLVGVVSALLSKTGMAPVAVLGISLSVGICGSLSNALLVNRFTLPSFVVTLAMASVFQGINHLVSNSSPVTQIPEWYKSVGQGYVGALPNIVIIMIVMAVIGFLLLNKTVFGKHVLAMGGNPEASRVCGVSLERTRFGVFIWIGISAAVTSFILTGRAASAQVGAGQGMELDSIAAVVIGGTPLAGGSGNVIGTIIGCLIIGVIGNGLNLLGVNSSWQYIVKGLLIVGAIILDVQSSKLSERLLKKSVSTK